MQDYLGTSQLLTAAGALLLLSSCGVHALRSEWVELDLGSRSTTELEGWALAAVSECRAICGPSWCAFSQRAVVSPLRTCVAPGFSGQLPAAEQSWGAMGQSPGRDDAAAVFLCVLFVVFFNACSELVNHCCCGNLWLFERGTEEKRSLHAICSEIVLWVVTCSRVMPLGVWW